MIRNRRKILAAVSVLIILSGCASVKPYQRQYLNDNQMQITASPAAQFEDYFQSIREGSVTSGSQKNSEGCGCK